VHHFYLNEELLSVIICLRSTLFAYMRDYAASAAASRKINGQVAAAVSEAEYIAAEQD